jgi:hypothetical protein
MQPTPARCRLSFEATRAAADLPRLPSFQTLLKLLQPNLQPLLLLHTLDLLHQHHRISVDVCGSAMQHGCMINIAFIRLKILCNIGSYFYRIRRLSWAYTLLWAYPRIDRSPVLYPSGQCVVLPDRFQCF